MERPLVDFAHDSSPAPLWAEAGHDASAFGAALDRVFGDAGDLHVIGHFTSTDAAMLAVDDPLVLLANLMDGFGLPMADPLPAPMPEFAAVYDFAPDSLNPHDLWVYDVHA